MTTYLRKALLVAAVLLPAATFRLSAQNAARSSDPDNYYALREKYLAQAQQAQQKQDDEKRSRHRDKDKDKASGEEEEDAMAQFERWDWYWKNRMDVSDHKDGQLANISLYMRSYYYATNGNVPPSNPTARGGSSPQLLSLSNPVCTGLGSWTSLGPGTATTTLAAAQMGLVSTIYVNPANDQDVYVGTRGGGVFHTTNNGSSWTNITDASRVPVPDITALAVDPVNPSVMYIASSFEAPDNAFVFAHRGTYGFGVLRSADGGNTWTEVLSLPNYVTPTGDVHDYIRAIKIHPQDHNVIYACGEYKVFMSTNGGTSWTVVLDVPYTGGANDCANQPNHIEILPGATGVVDSYVMVTTLATGWSMTGNYGCQPSRVYVSRIGGSLIGTSSSFTDNTSAILTGTAYTEEYAIAKQPGNNSDFFLAFYDFTSGQLCLSKYTPTSIGGTGASVSTGPNSPSSGASMISLVFSANNPNIIFIGGQIAVRYDLSGSGLAGGIAFSTYQPTTNDCGTPEAHHTHADIRCLAMTSNGTNDVLFLGDDGGIQKATFNPTTQTTEPIYLNMAGVGFNTTAFVWLAGTENRYDEMVAGTQDNGTFEYLAGTWQQRSGGDGYRGVINPGPATHQYYGYGGGMSTLGNIGSCYGYATSPGASYDVNPPYGYIYRGDWPIVSDPANPAVIYTMGYTGVSASPWGIYKSTNFGTSWTQLTGFPDADGMPIHCIRVSPSNSNVIYAAKEGPTWWSGTLSRFYRSTDGGVTWCDMQAGTCAATPTNSLFAVNGTTIMDIAIDPLNSNHVFVCFNGYWAATTGSLNGSNRVYESTDGGVNWTDITYNMMAFPVSALVYQGGTDDVLYAGTDVGVFRYNKNNTGSNKWDCFTNGLPVAPVTALEINHCKNKIRASTFGRGMWESPLPAINTPTGQLVVNASTTWSTSRRLTSDVFVTGNSNLTISSTIYMAAGKKFIIDRGSTLTVTGTGVLTNCCGDLWLGVEVWGTPTVSQTTAGAQGKVVLQTGAVISNCQEGIVTAKNLGGTLDLTYTGGLIQATGAYFYNNVRDAALYPYQYSIANNLSYFKSCTFETNAQIGNSLPPDVHVKMDGVKNVLEQGNHYRNTTSTAIYGVNSRGTGIYATNCDFTVDDFGTSSASTFDGLTAGVSANYTAGTVKKVQVLNTDFNNIQKGVEVNYSYSSYIQNNNFTNVPNAQSGNPAAATWAVRVNNTSVVTVSGNTISGASASYLNNYGVIAADCGTSGGTISTNTFSNIYTAIQAQGNNGSGVNGIQFKCNTFNASINFQIAVTPSAAGSLADQGSGCTLGNTRKNNFYTTGAPSCGQINVGSGTTFTYYASGTLPTIVCGGAGITNCMSVGDECSGGCTGCGRLAGADTTETGAINEMITLLEGDHSKESRVALEGAYLAAGRFQDAQLLLNEFHAEAGMEDVATYYEIMLPLAQSGGSLYKLTNDQLARMQTIAAGTSPVALSARVILEDVKGMSFERITEHFPEERLVDPASTSDVSALLQNMPNPFDNSTIISCTVPPAAQNATLEIRTADGREEKTIVLVPGENTITLQAGDLSSGVYYYTLVTDGKRVATKRMVIIKE